MESSYHLYEGSSNAVLQYDDFADPTTLCDDAEYLSNSSTMAESKKPPSRAANAMGTPHFEPSILAPRRITIRNSIEEFPDQRAFDHFGLPRPKPKNKNEFEAYRTIPELSQSTIWVRTDLEFATEVQEEWKALRDWSLNEGERETKAYEILLCAERRRPGFLPKSQFTTERMIKLNIKPQEDQIWSAPPVLEESASAYGPEHTWDISPDCTYWLSLQSFPGEHQNEIKNYVFVYNYRILTPYLFIEHKQNGIEYRKARHQIAAAAAMAVYSRFRLMKKRTERTKAPMTPRDKSLLKVYGLHMVGYEYGYWVIEAQLTDKDEWNGCTMTRLFNGILDDAANIVRYANWLNEIHRWGLTVHAPSIREDLAICARLVEPLKKVSKRERDESEEISMEGSLA